MVGLEQHVIGLQETVNGLEETISEMKQQFTAFLKENAELNRGALGSTATLSRQSPW